MGIYEIADEQRRTLYIGKAGGNSPFGLRGELVRNFDAEAQMEGQNWRHPRMGEVLPSIAGRARYYRYEVNHQYYGRWVEALTRYREDFGTLPPANLEDPEQPPPLGRYRWKSIDWETSPDAQPAPAAGESASGEGEGASDGP